MDPYRGTTITTCPRCNEQLVHGTSVECPRDCGIWHECSLFQGANVSDLGVVSTRQVRPGPCPACRKRMSQREWNGMVLEVCGGHGIWVDRSYLKAFLAYRNAERDQQVAERGRATETAAIVAELANPALHAAFAERFVAMRELVTDLAARLAAIETRVDTRFADISDEMSRLDTRISMK